jgi:hypothetical protein
MIDYLQASLKLIQGANAIIKITADTPKGFGQAPTTEVIRFFRRIIDIAKKVDVGADNVKDYFLQHSN